MKVFVIESHRHQTRFVVLTVFRCGTLIIQVTVISRRVSNAARASSDGHFCFARYRNFEEGF